MTTFKPLKIVADAFTELAAIVSSPSPDVSVKQFSDACYLFSHLFGVLERAFKFAKFDFVDKVNDLAKASSSISTLAAMIDKDIQANCVRSSGSHTRNLLKIKRALEMIRALFQEIIATNGNSSLKDAAFKAYNQVFAKHHPQYLHTAAASGMDSLPSLQDLLQSINETETTAKIHMQSYVSASTTVIDYLDKLFITKTFGNDW